MPETKNIRYPRLEELVFENRNKKYGVFYLRSKYPRYLLVSFLVAVFILLLLFLTPLLVYYFEPTYLLNGESITRIEYYALEPPSDEMLAEISRLLAKPPPEAPKVPVVVDSVTEKQDTVREEPLPPEEDTSKKASDSLSGKGPGDKGEGIGPGDETGIVTVIDVFPRFPGGDRSRIYYLRTQIHYPEIALKSGIQGEVIVLFVIETDGSVTNVQVTKGIGGGCDEEAIRVTKNMPKWQPGKRHGKPVRVMVKMPVLFRIPGKPAK